MGAICDGKIATLTSTKRNDLNLFCKLGFSELFSYPKTQHCCTRGSASETAQSVTFQLETHHQQRDKKRRSFFKGQISYHETRWNKIIQSLKCHCQALVILLTNLYPWALNLYKINKPGPGWSAFAESVSDPGQNEVNVFLRRVSAPVFWLGIKK